MTGNKTILLVDDDADFLAANKFVLEAAGYTVHVARNSSEAMRVAIQSTPDAAVLDIMMDQPDEGFVLARRFRQDSRTRGMRLVLLSSVNEINRQKGLGYRFSDQDRDEQWLPVDKVLEKPVRPKKLISILEKLMENEA
jgi:CheY-like chemotaxis protein